MIAGRGTPFGAAGTVNTYVDLCGLEDADLYLSEEGNAVTVRLPEPQLGKANLDQDRPCVFMQDRGVVDRTADAIETPRHTQFYQLAETKLAAAAEVSELRRQAAENTKVW